ncbi:uncharacterized protein LOC110685508 [Chenopodium quinoa]|uniref:uncharacterized protein LOC110685508 n=1 Tax=Chenopodium quinoa TaxID=63459 RepID=UPI000B78EF2E|nr:uncharacterized protein LOC110685508 [Chenopodium quinoa]
MGVKKGLSPIVTTKGILEIGGTRRGALGWEGNGGQSSKSWGIGNQRSEKPQRKYFCKLCGKDHRGKDCEGKPVTCRYCQKLGHRKYERYKKEADVKSGKVKESSAPNKPPQSSGPIPKVGTSSVVGGALKGRVLVMSSREAETANNVVINVFLISSLPVKVLFDSGASHSFISKRVVGSLGLESPESVSLYVSILFGEVRSCSKLFKSVPISISGVEFLSDLIEFDLKDLDKLVEKGCLLFLCSIQEIDSEENKGDVSIPVVEEFPNVFPDEIPGMNQ